MYAPPTSWPRHLFVSCTTTTCLGASDNRTTPSVPSRQSNRNAYSARDEAGSHQWATSFPARLPGTWFTFVASPERCTPDLGQAAPHLSSSTPRTPFFFMRSHSLAAPFHDRAQPRLVPSTSASDLAAMALSASPAGPMPAVLLASTGVVSMTDSTRLRPCASTPGS